VSQSTKNINQLKEQFCSIWVEGSAFPALKPLTGEDVMQVVVWCRENGWQILPVGDGHTFSDNFDIPSGVVTLLSISRDGIERPDPLDLALEVEAGVPSAAVINHVHQFGFRLDGWPEDYPGTVGGMICGVDGGKIRHLIMGVDIIDGRGRALRFGGRVRKDVSGFNIAGLFTASRGSLGWLDRVYLRLAPSGSSTLGQATFPQNKFSGSLKNPYARVTRALDPDNVFMKQIG
jgi:FAD/FMN-containing dehydrogenase